MIGQTVATDTLKDLILIARHLDNFRKAGSDQVSFGALVTEDDTTTLADVVERTARRTRIYE